MVWKRWCVRCCRAVTGGIAATGARGTARKSSAKELVVVLLQTCWSKEEAKSGRVRAMARNLKTTS